MMPLRSHRRLAFAGVVGTALLLGGAGRAEAQAGPRADVLVIHATDCEKPHVDPQIGEVPPLKYKCYKLVERKSLPLAKGKPSTTALPNGRTFQVTLTDVMADKRLKVSAAISQPDNKGFMNLAHITAEPNKQFHVGGFAHQGGALVLAIRILP
jgi:hypothetical protein